MSDSDQNGARLVVNTADPATEIFVLDARFRLAKRGIGRLDETLPPGLYVVRARSGPETREEAVVLSRDAVAPVTVTFEPIQFGSPAPLLNTGKTHEYHIEFAKRVSSTVQVRAGFGSWIFVSAREWEHQAASPISQPARSPLRGLSLHTQDGTLVADLDAAAEKELDVPDPCAACSIELDPGTYRLVLEAAPGLIVEQSIVASPGWQTQVFLLQRSYVDDPEWRRADLVGASILIADGPGFEPDHEEQRLAEMARFALRDGRRILSDDLRHMLNGKHSNPMLGIYGAHLLLRERELDEDQYRNVIEHVRAMLGNHPDVEALTLRVPDSAVPAIDAPPMLRRSWHLILNATVTRPDVVPADSFLEGIAPRVWGEGPWLIWLERSEAELASDLEQIARSMAAQVGATTPAAAANSRTTWASDALSDAATAADQDRASANDTDAGLERASFDDEESSSAGQTHLGGDFSFSTMANESFEVEDDGGVTAASDAVTFDDATVSRLVQSLGVPRSTIEKMIVGS